MGRSRRCAASGRTAQAPTNRQTRTTENTNMHTSSHSWPLLPFFHIVRSSSGESEMAATHRGCRRLVLRRVALSSRRPSLAMSNGRRGSDQFGKFSWLRLSSIGLRSSLCELCRFACPTGTKLVGLRIRTLKVAHSVKCRCILTFGAGTFLRVLKAQANPNRKVYAIDRRRSSRVVTSNIKLNQRTSSHSPVEAR